MENRLSHESEAIIDKMVERIASKAGYTGEENMTYKEILQTQIERLQNNIEVEISKYRKKLSIKPSNRDFIEEIKTYLEDGLQELMNKGHSEKEAIAITLDKFDETELNETFEEFLQEWDGFGINGKKMYEWSSKGVETIGLFYGSFVILGTSIGLLIGYFLRLSLLDILVGALGGLFVGIGLALFCNALISIKRG